MTQSEIGTIYIISLKYMPMAEIMSNFLVADATTSTTSSPRLEMALINNIHNLPDN